MYSSSNGSSTCTICGTNTQATIGCPAHSTNWPQNCPIGTGTKVDKGGTACTAVVENSFALPGVLTQIISGDGPLFGLLAVGAIFSAFAVFLLQLRQGDIKVVQIPMLAFLIGFISTGIALATEVLLIAVLFANKDIPLYTACGLLVILCRVAHIIPSCYLQYTISGHTQHSAHYLGLLEDTHYLENMAPYSIISILALLETSFYRFLPWKHTEFAFVAGGYPDFFLNRLCTYIKAGQATITVAIQFIFVLTVNSHVSNVSVSTQTVFVAGLCSTMLALLLSIHEAVTKVNLLRQVMQRIVQRFEHEEAQKSSAMISTNELGSVPSEKLAQMLRDEREAAAQAAAVSLADKERIKAELVRTQERLAKYEGTRSNGSTWSALSWIVGGKNGGEGEGSGARGGLASSAVDQHLRVEHEQVISPMAELPAIGRFSVGGASDLDERKSIVTIDHIPPPPSPPAAAKAAVKLPEVPSRANASSSNLIGDALVNNCNSSNGNSTTSSSSSSSSTSFGNTQHLEMTSMEQQYP